MCQGETPAIRCGAGCYQDPNFVAAPMCDETGWNCQPEHVDEATCEPDSCARAGYLCCDPLTGVQSFAACGPEGKREPCAPGSHRKGDFEYCRPQGVELERCASNQECPAPGHECHFPRGSCTCTDQSRWECSFILI